MALKMQNFKQNSRLGFERTRVLFLDSKYIS